MENSKYVRWNLWGGGIPELEEWRIKVSEEVGRGGRKSTREGMKFRGEILGERVCDEKARVASVLSGKWQK